jgi:hypothetical protein
MISSRLFLDYMLHTLTYICEEPRICEEGGVMAMNPQFHRTPSRKGYSNSTSDGIDLMFTGPLATQMSLGKSVNFQSRFTRLVHPCFSLCLDKRVSIVCHTSSFIHRRCVKRSSYVTLTWNESRQVIWEG